MRVDELIDKVAKVPAKDVTLSVRLLDPAVSTAGMRISDLDALPAQFESRVVRYGHILSAPAPPEVIEAWRAAHPKHPLPPDLQALASRINGVHLWAELDRGRSYTGLAPIEEWEMARIVMYGGNADQALLADRFLAISYHLDHSAFVVLDVESARYLLMDTCGPDQSCLIGNSVNDLLDWLWNERMAP